MSGFQKNVAGQKWRVFAFNETDNTAKTGDAANITVKLAKDNAAAAVMTDINPTETEDGYYLFDLDQGETNADVLDLYPQSSTANIQVIGVPGRVFTVPSGFAAGTASVDATLISGDATAADNLEAMYDGTGYVADTAPSTQSQLAGIANVGAAVNTPALPSPDGFVITTSGTEVNNEDNTKALDGAYHGLPDSGGTLDVYYEFNIGSGIPTSVTWTGYVTGNNDDISVYGYDWVASAWVQIGTISGKNATTNEVNSFELFTTMVGSTADEGTVRVRFEATGLSSALLNTDQIFVSFSQGQEGYENAAVWVDTGASNTGVVVGIDGVARNPVSTIGAANTLLATTNLHRIEYAPASSVTFAADQADQRHEGRDWTLALGGQNITGSFFLGATISGTGTATAKYEFEECDIGAVTLDNDGHFERCGMEATFTIGQAGTFTFHQCYTQSGGTITINFGALGATDVHLFDFHGEINFTNMAAGDVAHVTGNGTITTTTCTGGTIDHDGFFDYTDAGGNVTESKADIEDDVSAVLLDTGTTLDARIPAALVGGRIDATVDGTGMEAAAAQVVADLIIPKKNTALSNIEFLMIDSTDDITPKTGLTVAGTRSIDGGAFAGVSGTIAEVASGIYQFDALAADMNGAIITFRFTSAGANDRFLTIRTSG